MSGRTVSPVLNPDPAPLEDPIDTLARTIWGEARGEPMKGMEAVAAVVMNRVAVAEANGGHFWWGRDVVGVCRKPYQFSCWNAEDPNRAKVLQVDRHDPVFARCLQIASWAVAGDLPDPTEGATHYHAKSVSPFWAKGKSPTVIIDNHIFYRLEA